MSHWNKFRFSLGRCVQKFLPGEGKFAASRAWCYFSWSRDLIPGQCDVIELERQGGLWGAGGQLLERHGRPLASTSARVTRSEAHTTRLPEGRSLLLIFALVFVVLGERLSLSFVPEGRSQNLRKCPRYLSLCCVWSRCYTSCAAYTPRGRRPGISATRAVSSWVLALSWRWTLAADSLAKNNLLLQQRGDLSWYHCQLVVLTIAHRKITKITYSFVLKLKTGSTQLSLESFVLFFFICLLKYSRGS